MDEHTRMTTERDQLAQLLPCPFCGSDPKVYEVLNGVTICCPHGPLTCPAHPSVSESGHDIPLCLRRATESWNKRKGVRLSEQQATPVDALRGVAAAAAARLDLLATKPDLAHGSGPQEYHGQLARGLRQFIDATSAGLSAQGEPPKQVVREPSAKAMEVVAAELCGPDWESRREYTQMAQYYRNKASVLLRAAYAIDHSGEPPTGTTEGEPNSCGRCGGPVRVQTSKEGTSHYEPLGPWLPMSAKCELCGNSVAIKK